MNRKRGYLPVFSLRLFSLHSSPWALRSGHWLSLDTWHPQVGTTSGSLNAVTLGPDSSKRAHRRLEPSLGFLAFKQSSSPASLSPLPGDPEGRGYRSQDLLFSQPRA